MCHIRPLQQKNQIYPKGHIAASAPPQTIKSALLFLIIVNESPIACVPVAHAVTGELFGPFKLYLIDM